MPSYNNQQMTSYNNQQIESSYNNQQIESSYNNHIKRQQKVLRDIGKS